MTADTVNSHHAEHREVFSARPEALYDLVADVSRWPVLFGPTVYVHVIDGSPMHERFHIWAITNGSVTNWTSRRVRNKNELRIDFEQERSSPPLASMRGSWRFFPLAGGGTEVILRHEFTTEPGREDAVGWVKSALDTNSAAEFDSLRMVTDVVAENLGDVETAAFSFTDSLETPGSAERAYEFLRASDRWPEHLPHVRAVRLSVDESGVQDMEMETLTGGGATHVTRSTRVCFPHESIVYKQTKLPKLLLGHSGRWSFVPSPGGVVISSRHTVLLHTSAIDAVLGAGTTLAKAKGFVRRALGANSRTTMELAAKAAGV